MNINWKVFAVSFAFSFAETWYFGWNMWPNSDAEVVADMVSFAFLLLAYIL